ncbi:MAG: flagellar assembly peptidoglycan hydrolase FlgJ [Gammaproteobacteria bacterium]|nr:flagellar assembly peptidoglycan hydrolase FlgJ [Gammaproteobacteria bacterium]
MATAARLNPAADLARFGALRADAKRDPDAAMGEVAREFEALFVQMMLKAARDATPATGMFDSHEMRFYQEMFDSQVALSMAEQGGVGFEQMLRKQLAPGGRNPDAANAVSDGERVLKLPARRAFPREAGQYQPQAEIQGDDEAVTDITRWARPRSAFTSAAPAARDTADVDTHQQRFVDSLRPHAERAARKLGTTPEILMAQAALETGWGRHVVGGSSHNLFSIKADRAWDGRTVTQRTLEIFDGQPVRVSAAFRAYRDIGAAFDDYAAFIQQNPRYERALQRAADPRAYVQELQRAGYATDPSYAQKILRIHGRLAAVETHRG